MKATEKIDKLNAEIGAAYHSGYNRGYQNAVEQCLMLTKKYRARKRLIAVIQALKGTK